jgi:hypothetical protein
LLYFVRIFVQPTVTRKLSVSCLRFSFPLNSLVQIRPVFGPSLLQGAFAEALTPHLKLLFYLLFRFFNRAHFF